MKKMLTFLTTCMLSSQLMADVMVKDAYARAVPPGQMNSAAFMQLHNSDAKAIALVGAQSSIAKRVELHTHTHEDGVMSMRKVDDVPVAANGHTELKPGGYHVMLMGLTQTLKADQQIDLTLKFSDGTEKALQIPVKSVVKKPMKMDKKHTH